MRGHQTRPETFGLRIRCRLSMLIYLECRTVQCFAHSCSDFRASVLPRPTSTSKALRKSRQQLPMRKGLKLPDAARSICLSWSTPPSDAVTILHRRLVARILAWICFFVIKVFDKTIVATGCDGADHGPNPIYPVVGGEGPRHDCRPKTSRGVEAAA